MLAWGPKLALRLPVLAIKYVREGTPVVIENPDGVGGEFGRGRILPPVQNVKNEMFGVLPGLPGNPGLPGARL